MVLCDLIWCLIWFDPGWLSFQDFTHQLGFHISLRFWGALCFEGGLWSSVFVLGVFVFITIICITCNQPHIFVDSAHKSATLWFTRWALFAVKWVAIIFSSDLLKIFKLLDLILANPDVVKTFSAWFTQTWQFVILYIL